MRLYLSRKMGPFRLGGSIKLTWWNAFFIAIAAMVYYAVYLVILFFELFVMFGYYMIKWTFLGFRAVFRAIKIGIVRLISFIKSKTAGQ